jgi:hypothetical protein
MVSGPGNHPEVAQRRRSLSCARQRSDPLQTGRAHALASESATDTGQEKGKGSCREMTRANSQMGRTDRESLLRIARLRERTTKNALVELGAQLLADLEQRITAVYHYDQDEIWKEAYRIAEQEAKIAQAKVKERSRELGIPERFAPRAGFGLVSPRRERN